jgi:hypothetical protein
METDKSAIAVKVHETAGGTVIGACDTHLVGKKLVEKGLRIEISKEFYFERHASEEELVEIIETCMTANIVGEKAVESYCRKNPDARGAVRKICGVPHLQVFRI